MLRSGGVPVYDNNSILDVRLARPNEAALYRKAADASQSPDDLLLIYLVELDVVAEEQAVEPEAFPSMRT